MLPGIIGKSIAMSDAHQGYGFSIGGVAVFDIEKGIISPGGVGYDINCLTGDSRILTEFGQSVKIEDFRNLISETEISYGNKKVKKVQINKLLPTLNFKTKKIEGKPVRLFMSRDSKEVFEIELNSGIKIKATKDHPFLTKKGMINLEDLQINDKLAVNLFEGIEDNDEIGPKKAILTKVLGYMFGDGTLYRTKERIYGAAYGSEEDLETMKEDLQRIGVNSKIYSRKRKHKIQTRYQEVNFETTNHELHIHSKPFNELLEKAGMPLGNKTRQEVRVPKWIMNGTKVIKRLFLAGFFGAEMSSPSTLSKTCFYCPTIDQNKIEELKQNCRDFFIDISMILEEFGIEITKISEMRDFKNRYDEKTFRLRLLVASKEENKIKLWRQIGFEYNKKRQNLSNIASLYILLKKQENKKRIELAKKIKSYKKKGFKLKEMQKILKRKINSRFIERHYYENVKQRINLDFPSFKDFSKKKLNELENYGTIFDSIKNIRKIPGNHKVYDFTIEDNHNFIANCFVVSNCGVRLLSTNLMKKDFSDVEIVKKVLNQLFRDVPSGVGTKGRIRVDDKQLDDVLINGAKWAVDNDYGIPEDLKHIEENGKIPGAIVSAVSQRARKRGKPQLGSLGAGNHFVEVGYVDEVFDSEVAKKFGLKKNQVTIMIHCGSRGLGHQVASDYIKAMEEKYGFPEQDRELVNAPIKSELGKKYFGAMACAANFAFANRQMIMHWVREAMKRIFPKFKGELVYDIAHNIAKFEQHLVNGKKKEVLIMRKGATRSFKDIPVLIPGSMGTASYVLVGTKEAEQVSFGSTAHGAGRVHSRTYARKNFNAEKIKKKLSEKGILVKSGGFKGIVEEAPEVYKDIDEVVKVSHEAGIGKLVARLKPLGVVKG